MHLQTLIYITYKPGLPRFARSTILVISPSHWMQFEIKSWYYVFSVRCRASVVPLLYPCCSSHVPHVVHLLYPCCSSHVLLFCLSCTSCTYLALFRVPPLLPFTRWNWEVLKIPYRGPLLFLFRSSWPYRIKPFKRNSKPSRDFLPRGFLVQNSMANLSFQTNHLM